MNFEESLMPDIAEAVKGAFKATESPPPSSTASDDAAPPPPAKDGDPPVDAPASGGERARDAAGKFVKGEEKPAGGKDKNQPSPAETASGAQPQALTAQAIAPPANWKGAARLKWAELHPFGVISGKEPAILGCGLGFEALWGAWPPRQIRTLSTHPG